MIVNHEVTLRLKWGYDAAREITLPVEYRKGSYSGRYELYIDDVHFGWVVKHEGQWHGYLVAEQNDGYQREVGGATRRDAVDEVVYRLTDHARINVLASRAEEAYAS